MRNQPFRKRAVFLDRDGVLNRSALIDGKPYAPRRLSDFILLPGATKAVSELRAAGFVTVVVTNQPDVRTGLITRDILDAMHMKLAAKTEIDAILVCTHISDDNCDCRKPKPGLFFKAQKDLSIDLASSWMIGDRWSDIAAGQAAGCRTIRISKNYSENCDNPITANLNTDNLPKAVRHILGTTSHD